MSPRSLSKAGTLCHDEGERKEQVSPKEPSCELSGISAEDPLRVHGGDATESDDIGEDDGIARRGGLGIPSRPVQHGNPEAGSAKIRRKAISAGGASGGTAPMPKYWGTNMTPRPTRPR